MSKRYLSGRMERAIGSRQEQSEQFAGAVDRSRYVKNKRQRLLPSE